MTATKTPPEVLDKWREEFKECYEREYNNASEIKKSLDLNIAWVFWFLARQSVVIDLPDDELLGADKHSEGVNIGVDECRMAIRRQGYRVEVKS